jgi:decaprenylphospho-beta-D-erythro-pentofuranosid-2-ulose 2-reductase
MVKNCKYRPEKLKEKFMKTALILGATSDIGRHIASGLAKRNFDLILTGTNLELLEEIKNSILGNYNILIDCFYFDAMDYPSHEKFYTSIKTKPDIIFCCIGYYQNQDKARTEFKELYKTISINYLGILSILNIISLDFENRKSGNIVVLSSVAGIRGRQLNYIYGSSKAGLTTYLSGLRNKLFRYNISVTNINLGPVYTKMSQGHKLLPILTLRPEVAAEKIIKAGLQKKDSVYIFWIWKYIMLVISLIPEWIFKRLKPF